MCLLKREPDNCTNKMCSCFNYCHQSHATQFGSWFFSLSEEGIQQGCALQLLIFVSKRDGFSFGVTRLAIAQYIKTTMNFTRNFFTERVHVLRGRFVYTARYALVQTIMSVGWKFLRNRGGHCREGRNSECLLIEVLLYLLMVRPVYIVNPVGCKYTGNTWSEYN